MKYALSLFSILFLLLFSLQTVQAQSQSGVAVELMLDVPGVDIFNDPSNIGIGRMQRIVRDQSPIQALAARANPQEAARRAARAGEENSGGRIGARLVAVMGDMRPRTESVVDVDSTLAVSTDIVGTDTDVNTDLFQEGRMYTPKLVVDYQKFPIPTYAAMSGEVRQTRLDRLNSQLQKRFGETVQIDYRENIHYLRGTVPSERQKEVLELFLKMEPGIQEIRNEVVVRL